MLISIVCKWFDLSPNDDVAWAIAGLPKREGGCGFVVSSPLRSFAYDDSCYKALAEFGRNDPEHQRPMSQRDATQRMHKAAIDRVTCRTHPDAVKIARLLEANKMKGAGGWIDEPTQWMPPDAFSSAWRLRCRAKCRSLPDGAMCPGCPTLGVMSQVDFASHAHGCTRCPSGQNATDAHNHLSKHIAKACSDNALHAVLEPRGFQSFTCGTCKEVLSGADLHSKIRTHDRRCSMKLYRRGVDLEVYLHRRRRMIDFTIAHVTTPSWCSTPIANIVDLKKNEKCERYVKSGMIPEDEFVVATAFSSGALHEDFTRLLTDIATCAVIDYELLVKSVRNCVMWGQGASVAAAFRTVMQAPVRSRGFGDT